LSIINSYAAAHFSFFSGVQRYDILAIKAKKVVKITNHVLWPTELYRRFCGCKLTTFFWTSKRIFCFYSL